MSPLAKQCQAILILIRNILADYLFTLVSVKDQRQKVREVDMVSLKDQRSRVQKVDIVIPSLALRILSCWFKNAKSRLRLFRELQSKNVKLSDFASPLLEMPLKNWDDTKPAETIFYCRGLIGGIFPAKKSWFPQWSSCIVTWCWVWEARETRSQWLYERNSE